MDKKKKKEYFDYLEKQEFDEWFPFQCIVRRINFLKMFAKVINNHPEELSPSYQRLIKKRNIKPSEPLFDFFLQDIRNFYWVAFKKFKHTIEYPETHEAVRKLRDNSISHFTKDNPKEVTDLYREIGKFGFKKIYSDYEEFRDKIKVKILGK